MTTFLVLVVSPDLVLLLIMFSKALVPCESNFCFCCLAMLVTKLVVADLISVVTFGLEKLPVRFAFTGIFYNLEISPGDNFANNPAASFPKYFAGTSNFKL